MRVKMGVGIMVGLIVIGGMITGCTARSRIARGDYYMRTGNQDSAVKAYTSSLKMQDSYDARIRRGIVLNEAGHPDLAVSDFAVAEELAEKGDWHPGVFKAEALIKLGKFEEALDVVDDLVSRSPNNVYLTSLRGQIWYAMGEYDHALSDFNRAISSAKDVEPEFKLSLLYNKSISLFKLGRYADAKDSFSYYIRTKEDSGMALTQDDYYNMGLFCYSNYDYDEAMSYWKNLSRTKRKAIVSAIDEEYFVQLVK